MTLLQRVGYYLGGFSIGLVVLAFFLNGKNASCSYGPSARVKKNISTKTLDYSNQVKSLIEFKNIDSISIKRLIANGSVNFSESNTKLDSCKLYVIDGELENVNYKLTIENCDSIATIQKMEYKKAR